MQEWNPSVVIYEIKCRLALDKKKEEEQARRYEA